MGSFVHFNRVFGVQWMNLPFIEYFGNAFVRVDNIDPFLFVVGYFLGLHRVVFGLWKIICLLYHTHEDVHVYSCGWVRYTIGMTDAGMNSNTQEDEQARRAFGDTRESGFGAPSVERGSEALPQQQRVESEGGVGVVEGGEVGNESLPMDGGQEASSQPVDADGEVDQQVGLTREVNQVIEKAIQNVKGRSVTNALADEFGARGLFSGKMKHSPAVLAEMLNRINEARQAGSNKKAA
jgi:hypothetical protein